MNVIFKSDNTELIFKFNPHHDARGRFSNSDRATSFTYSPGKSKAHDMAIEREKKRHEGTAAVDDNAPGGKKSPLAKPQPTDIENERQTSVSIQGAQHWKRQHREAIDEGNGVINLQIPSNLQYEQISRNQLKATGQINHGYVAAYNSKNPGSWVGINWSNVTAVKGETFEIKTDIKSQGFKWDGNSKMWVRP